jgi:hypothetical protein
VSRGQRNGSLRPLISVSTPNYSVSIERFVVSIILRAVTVLHAYVSFCSIFFSHSVLSLNTSIS